MATFSTTLRRAPSLAPLIPHLTSSTDPKFHETTIQTHHLSLPLPQPHQTPVHLSDSTNPSTNYTANLLVLILTLTDILPRNEATTLERIDRFANLVAEPTPLLAFILDTLSSQTAEDDNEPTEGLPGLMRLQILLHTFPRAHQSPPPPLLPIPTLSALLPLVKTYTTTLCASIVQSPHPPSSAHSARSLLPHLTPHAPYGGRLSEHTVNVLSDVCGSMGDVAALAGDEGGRGELCAWVGEGEGREVMGFWVG